MESFRERIQSGDFQNEIKETAELEAVYSNSEIANMLDAQDQRGEPRTAMFSDIDNTIYRAGTEEATQRLAESGKDQSYPIIANTGNDYETVRLNIESGKLPRFQAIIGQVGTEIWVSKDQDGVPAYIKDEYFEELLKQTGFDRSKVAQEAQRIIDTAGQDYPDWELDFQNPGIEEKLVEQPDPDYQPFKVSFYSMAEEDDLEELSSLFKERYPGQAIVICEEIGYNRSLPPDASRKKYCIDVLPATKRDAVVYMSSVLGIKRGVVAGDSGNDVDMLIESGDLNAILVGGYKPEALEGVRPFLIKDKEGRSGFQRIRDSQGRTKAIFIENDPSRLAANSILHAAEVFRRAQKIKDIRDKKNQ